MDRFLDGAATSGDLVWLIPAAIGGVIVVITLLRLLFSRQVTRALAFLVAFGGVLSGLSLVSSVQFGTGGFFLETVAAAHDASEELKAAVSTNTEAIEAIGDAVADIQKLSESVASRVASVNGTPATGSVAITDTAIKRINQDIVSKLNRAEASIEASKVAEQNAIKNLATLNQLIEQKR